MGWSSSQGWVGKRWGGAPWAGKRWAEDFVDGSTYEAFQVADGAGGYEDFQVPDGEGGYKNYEVAE